MLKNDDFGFRGYLGEFKSLFVNFKLYPLARYVIKNIVWWIVATSLSVITDAGEIGKRPPKS